MARPIKLGLDYFPFDVDFFSDEKLCVIAGEFGIKGEITTVKLLCAVYRNGYYIEWNDMLKYKLLKELPGVSAELLDSIIRRLVKWDFFDKDLFDTASVLTSRGIQRRFQTICSKMHRKNAITEFYLLADDPPQSTPVAPNVKPQRKPQQQKKVGKPSAPAVADTSPLASKTPPKPITLDKSIPKLLSDKIWYEPVCMRYELHTHDEFVKKINEFKQYCICMGRNEHNDIVDVKRHFCLWLNSERTRNNRTQSAIPSSNDNDYSFSGGFGGKDV